MQKSKKRKAKAKIVEKIPNRKMSGRNQKERHKDKRLGINPSRK